jgi:hypothetical protein
LQTIVKCADDFTRALSLANKYRELTGKSLPLDDLPSPTALRQCLERQDYSLALKEVAMIKTHMQVLLHAARQQLSPLRVRIDDLLD